MATQVDLNRLKRITMWLDEKGFRAAAERVRSAIYEIEQLRDLLGQLKALGQQYHADYRSDMFAHETLRLLNEAGVSETKYLPVHYNGKSAQEWYHEYCQVALKQQKEPQDE